MNAAAFELEVPEEEDDEEDDDDMGTEPVPDEPPLLVLNANSRAFIVS